MWLHIREYRARKEEGRAADRWAKASGGNAMMCALYGSLFAVLFLISIWAYFVMDLHLAGWPILLALLGCFVAIVVGAILMGRLKSNQFPSR